MTYTIRIRIVDRSPSGFVEVEKTVWYYANGGTWSEADGTHILTMGGSGTSGTLRFWSESTGETFLVALGVHNYKHWCDIQTDLKPDDTAMKLHPTYYGGDHSGMLWEQLGEISKTSSGGRQVSVVYTEGDGNNLSATVTIN